MTRPRPHRAETIDVQQRSFLDVVREQTASRRQRNGELLRALQAALQAARVAALPLSRRRKVA